MYQHLKVDCTKITKMLTPCRKNSKLKKLQVKRWLRNEQADFYPETYKKSYLKKTKKQTLSTEQHRQILTDFSINVLSLSL